MRRKACAGMECKDGVKTGYEHSQKCCGGNM